MADMVTVRAGWALWAKRPGTRQDYSVLACSPETFSRTDFAAIIARFAVGSPDVNAAGPAALPWATVSWVGVDGDPQLGISVTSDSGQVDGVGRPIAQTAYFCVPYAQLARTPVSYCDLFDSVVAQVPLLRPSDGPVIPLAVPAMSADRLADTVRRAGEQTATVAAALLLSRPVSVVQAEGASLRDRLEFIDAVASLLPYGYRVRFSGATWSDTGTKHRVRLAFAGRPLEGAAVVYWRRTVDLPPGDPLATAYCTKLRRLAEDPARAREGLGLPAVIGRLAADAEARTFDRPQAALDSLARLDQPFHLVRAVRNREQVGLEELREFFRSGSARELRDEADVVALLANFAGQAEPRDWGQLRREVSNLRGKEDQVRILVTFGKRMLWTVPQDAAGAVDSLRFAAQLGHEDAVLAEFLRQPEEPADRQVGAQPAAQLVAETILAPQGTGLPYPLARQVLLDNPGLTAECVVALTRSHHAVPLLRWLDPEGTWVLTRLFSVVLGITDGWVSSSDLDELDACGRGDSVRLLLQAASNAGNLDKVLPGFTNWLGGSGELRHGDHGYWLTHLSGLVCHGPQPQAWLDTTLLMVGGPPSGLPPVQWSAAARYADMMARIWTDLSKAYPLFNAEACARALAGYLGQQPWAADAERATGVAELARRLFDFDPSGSVASVVSSSLAATPAARSWEFARDWLNWAAAREPEAVRGRLFDSLAAPPGTDPGTLAGLCASACAAGIDAETALPQLAKSGALAGAAQVMDMFAALQQAFDEAEVDDEVAEAWQIGFSELVATGEFGTDFVPAARALFSEQARRDIRLDLRLLAIFAEDGNDDRQYEWTDAEREDLTVIAETIESMLKKSRKFQLPKMRRFPAKGGGPDELTVGRSPGAEAEAGPGHGEGPAVPGREAERSTGTGDIVPVPGWPE